MLMPIEEAQQRLFTATAPVAREMVSLRDAAGRWAAEDIAARRTQPASDLSAMDGYAIRFDDLPGPWSLIGESAAGRPFDGIVKAGDAARIFTGAVLPKGADSVLVQEEAAVDHGQVTLAGEGPPHRGRNTRRRGLDFSAGDVLVRTGERLNAARIAVAAVGGHATLPARRLVRVAIAATGDELVTPGQAVDGLALPESNGVMLAAMLADLPVELVDLGILPDRQDIMRDAFATVEADLLVTTGGASVGDHDLVRPALEEAGGVIDFWRIALRPGKPMMAGRLGDAAMLGLPGNPVSAYVTALLFVRPLIAHMAGATDPLPRTIQGILGEDLSANKARTDYLRAELRDGLAFASTVQDSSMLLTLARSSCLIVRPANAPVAKAGDTVQVLLIA